MVPIRYFHPSSSKILRIICPIIVLSMGVHINFVERNNWIFHVEQLYWPFVSWKTSKICTWEFWAIWEYPPILVECRQILHKILVGHNQAILQFHFLLLRQSFGTQTRLVQSKLRKLQSHLSQCHFGTSLCLCLFVICVLTPFFSYENTSFNVAKWTSLWFQKILLFDLDII